MFTFSSNFFLMSKLLHKQDKDSLVCCQYLNYISFMIYFINICSGLVYPDISVPDLQTRSRWFESRSGQEVLSIIPTT